MHKIMILAKILLKGGAGFTGGPDSKKGKSRWWLIPLLLFAFGSFAFSIVFMTFGLYDFLNPMGAADAIISLAFGATSLVVFLFGVFYVVSVMYHADDVSLLLGLPLRPYQILGAKFVTLVVYEYIFEAFILVPMLVAYGIKSGAGVLYVVYSVILFALLPIIALVLAAVIVMLVMRFTRFGKNKQVFNFVGGIIAIAVAVGFNVFIQTSVNNISSEQLLAFATGQSSLSAILSRVFPGIGFASAALSQSTALSGLWNLLLFVLCAAAATGVFLGIGQLIYFQGLAGVTESAAKRKKLSSEAFEKSTARASVTKAYVMKELRLLVRSPIAFLNCVLMNFIWPVLMLVMLMGSGQLETLKPYITAMDSGLLIAILVGMGAFISNANLITSTAISREGRTFYFAKFIPVSMSKQLDAKAISGILLSGVGLVLLAVLAVIMGVGILTAVVALVLSLVASVGSSYMGLLIDAGHPKLSWMNEQQAIKQNANGMLQMLVGVIFGAAIIVPVAVSGMPDILAIVFVAMLVLIVTVVVRQRVIKGSAAKLEQMDV